MRRNKKKKIDKNSKRLKRQSQKLTPNGNPRDKKQEIWYKNNKLKLTSRKKFDDK